jgi:hypothetical protein
MSYKALFNRPIATDFRDSLTRLIRDIVSRRGKRPTARSDDLLAHLTNFQSLWRIRHLPPFQIGIRLRKSEPTSSVGSHRRVHFATARPGRFRVVSHQLRAGLSHGALHFLQVRVSAIARASNGCFSANTASSTYGYLVRPLVCCGLLRRPVVRARTDRARPGTPSRPPIVGEITPIPLASPRSSRSPTMRGHRAKANQPGLVRPTGSSAMAS